MVSLNSALAFWAPPSVTLDEGGGAYTVQNDNNTSSAIWIDSGSSVSYGGGSLILYGDGNLFSNNYSATVANYSGTAFSNYGYYSSIQATLTDGSTFPGAPANSPDKLQVYRDGSGPEVFDFIGTNGTSGTDNCYGSRSENTIIFVNPSSSSFTTSGTLTGSGGFTSFSTHTGFPWLDIRSLDSSENPVVLSPPTGFPDSVRVNGDHWNHIGVDGQGALHYARTGYAGRLIISPSGTGQGFEFTFQTDGSGPQSGTGNSSYLGYLYNNVFYGHDMTLNGLLALNVDNQPWNVPALPGNAPSPLLVALPTMTNFQFQGIDGTGKYHYLNPSDARAHIVFDPANGSIQGYDTGIGEPLSGSFSGGTFSISGPTNPYQLYALNPGTPSMSGIWGTCPALSVSIDLVYLGETLSGEEFYSSYDGSNQLLLDGTSFTLTEPIAAGTISGTVDPNTSGHFFVTDDPSGSGWFLHRTDYGGTAYNPGLVGPPRIQYGSQTLIRIGSQSGTDYYIAPYSQGIYMSISSTGACILINGVGSSEITGQYSSIDGTFSSFPSGVVLSSASYAGSAFPPTGDHPWSIYMGTDPSGSLLRFRGNWYGWDHYGVPGSPYSVRITGSTVHVLNSGGGVIANGSYSLGQFQVNNGIVLRARTQQGTQPTARYHTTGPVYVLGSPWQYGWSIGNLDYYFGPQYGQRLSISNTGAVVYNNPVIGVYDRSGSFAGGQFTGFGPGVDSTITTQGSTNGNLDVNGNTIALGAWDNDPNTAGATIHYTDQSTATPPKGTLAQTLSRSSAEWTWNKAASSSPTNTSTVKMMSLEEGNKLKLFNPATPGQAAITLDPSGTTSFNGALNVGALTVNNQPILAPQTNQPLLINSGGLNINPMGGSGVANSPANQSVTIGQGLVTTSPGQIVLGRHNTASSGDILVIGAGSSPGSTKNALSVSTSGDTTIAGNLKVDGNSVLQGNSLQFGKAELLTSGSSPSPIYSNQPGVTLNYYDNRAVPQFNAPINENVTWTQGTDENGNPYSYWAFSDGTEYSRNDSVTDVNGNTVYYYNSGTAEVQRFSTGGYSGVTEPSGLAQFVTSQPNTSFMWGSGSGYLVLGPQGNLITNGSSNSLPNQTLPTEQEWDPGRIMTLGLADSRYLSLSGSNDLILNNVTINGTLTTGGNSVLTQGDIGTLVAAQAEYSSLSTALTALTSDVTTNYLTNNAAASLFVPRNSNRVEVGTLARIDPGMDGVAIGGNSHAGHRGVALGSDVNGGPGYFAGNYAITIGSHAHGQSDYSITIGAGGISTSEHNIAIGTNSVANIESGVAIGRAAFSNQFGQVVIGAFNEISPLSYQPGESDQILIVGAGTSYTNRRNALVVKRNGDTEVKGGLTSSSLTISGATNLSSLNITGAASIGGALTVGGQPVLNQAVNDARYYQRTANSFAFGTNSIAGSNYSVAMGVDSQAAPTGTTSGDASIALGKKAKAGLSAVQAGIVDPVSGTVRGTPSGDWGQGEGAIAIGTESSAGPYSTAIGTGAYARYASFALGRSTAYGTGSFALGYLSTAIGGGSIAWGNQCGASGDYSMAIGYASSAGAAGSMVFGKYSGAGGLDSLAMGYEVNAATDNSVAIGRGVIASRWGQVVLGTFNDPTSYSNNAPQAGEAVPLFIIGNGTSGASRSNAFVVKRNGDTEVKGGLSVAGTITQGGLPLVVQGSGDDAFLTAGQIGASFIDPSELNAVLAAERNTSNGLYLTPVLASQTYATISGLSVLENSTEASLNARITTDAANAAFASKQTTEAALAERPTLEEANQAYHRKDQNLTVNGTGQINGNLTVQGAGGGTITAKRVRVQPGGDLPMDEGFRNDGGLGAP